MLLVTLVMVLLLASFTIGFIAGRTFVAPAVPPPLPKEAVAVAGPTTVPPTLALAQPADATPTRGVQVQTVAVAQPTAAEPPIAAQTAAADPTVAVAEPEVAAAEPPTITAPPSHTIAAGSVVYVAPLTGQRFHIRTDCPGLRNNSGLERVAVPHVNSQFFYGRYTPCRFCCSKVRSEMLND